MSLDLSIYVLQFIQCFLNIVRLVIFEHHILRQKNVLFGVSHLTVIHLPTFFAPMVILIFVGFTSFWSFLRVYIACHRLWVANERLLLSGVLRQKSTSIVLRHGVDELCHRAISDAVIGLSGVMIGGVYGIFGCNLISQSPMPEVYPIVVLLLALLTTNVAHFIGLTHRTATLKGINTFLIDIRNRQLNYLQSNSKKYPLSVSNLLLVLFDTGFSKNIFCALTILDESLSPIESNVQHFSYDQVVSDKNEEIAESLKHVCKQLQKEIMGEKKGLVIKCLARAVMVETINVRWEVTSLALNSFALLFYLPVPLFAFLLLPHTDMKGSILYVGDMLGNACWMLEAVAYIVCQHRRSNILHMASFKQKNE